MKQRYGLKWHYVRIDILSMEITTILQTIPGLLGFKTPKRPCVIPILCTIYPTRQAGISTMDSNSMIFRRRLRITIINVSRYVLDIFDVYI